MNSKKNRDLELALNLHDELNIVGVTENAIIPKDVNIFRLFFVSLMLTLFSFFVLVISHIINLNVCSQKNKHYKPKTLVDQTLEVIDPTPNIYTLFMQFNSRFFWNVLLSVQVKWSNRMTRYK